MINGIEKEILRYFPFFYGRSGNLDLLSVLNEESSAVTKWVRTGLQGVCPGALVHFIVFALPWGLIPLISGASYFP
jgi:hypothetical protein